MTEKYKFFVVFHDSLKREYYSPTLISNYEFINVNPKNELNLLNKSYQIINQWEFEHYYPLGKFYTESEVMYNLYKNSYLYEKLDYIGFLQHDIDSSRLTNKVIEGLIYNCDHVNFQPYLFDVDYNQKILMDIDQPDKKVGDGVNCYDVIIDDFNKFYGTTFKKNDLNNLTINLCASFILKKEVFEKMMLFIISIIESGKLNAFDLNRKYRIQGGYLERYYAVWLTLKGIRTKEFKLTHHFSETNSENSLVTRIIRKVGLSNFLNGSIGYYLNRLCK